MPQLDGLRFIAVSWVVMDHFSEGTWLNYWFGYLAYFGVTLFFVLSGFLITQILINSDRSIYSLRQFYIRRFLRIFPLYYLVVFGSIILKIPEARGYFPWLITYMANYPAGLTFGGLGYLTHLWSLSVEEQFYIFFPLFVFIISGKNRPNAFLILVGLSILSRILLYAVLSNKEEAIWVTYMFTPCCFDSFAIGALLAHFRLRNFKYLESILRKKYIFMACGLFCFTVPFLNVLGKGVEVAIFRTIFSVFCFWMIGNASLDRFKGALGSFLTNPIVTYLGKISYGIYVYHHFTPWIFSHWQIPHARLYYIPTTIILSALSWHFFEHPINNLKNRFKYHAKLA